MQHTDELPVKKEKKRAKRRRLLIESRPKLLILDLNGVLVKRIPFSSDYSVRPYCREFIKHFSKLFTLAVWTSISRANGKLIVKDLFSDFIVANSEVETPSDKLELLFCYYQDQCVIPDEDDYDDAEGAAIAIQSALDPAIKPVYTKPLNKVWSRFPLYTEKNTLLLDDSPSKCKVNPTCTSPFFPVSYTGAKDDEELKPGSVLWLQLEAAASWGIEEGGQEES